VGAKASIDALRSGEAKLVVVAANCPENEKADITQFAKLGGIRVQVFEGTSWDRSPESICKDTPLSAV